MQKSFVSDFRKFRERNDYVSQGSAFKSNPSSVSDDEFDQIIQEFEQAHWKEISASESNTHREYIESLFKREFWERKHGNSAGKDRNASQSFETADVSIYYHLLGVSNDSTGTEIKKAYRRLILKWHPDKNPKQSKYAEKMLISIKLAFDQVMRRRKRESR